MSHAPTTISARLSAPSVAWYEQNFHTKTYGATYVLDAFPAVIRKTLYSDLRGIFTAGELSLILDVCNGLAFTIGLAGNHLPIQVDDGMVLDGLDKKWGVDRDQFLKKLRHLSTVEIFCLELWAGAFWLPSQVQGIADYIRPMTTPNVVGNPE